MALCLFIIVQYNNIGEWIEQYYIVLFTHLRQKHKIFTTTTFNILEINYFLCKRIKMTHSSRKFSGKWDIFFKRLQNYDFQRVALVNIKNML